MQEGDTIQFTGDDKPLSKKEAQAKYRFSKPKSEFYAFMVDGLYDVNQINTGKGEKSLKVSPINSKISYVIPMYFHPDAFNTFFESFKKQFQNNETLNLNLQIDILINKDGDFKSQAIRAIGKPRDGSMTIQEAIEKAKEFDEQN